MSSKLLLVFITLALFSIGQSQAGWVVLNPVQVASLSSATQFQFALNLCKDRLATTNKTFDFLYFVRTGPNSIVEYNLNDTDGNCHVCRTQKRLANPPIAISYYHIVQKIQGKSVVSDTTQSSSNVQILPDSAIEGLTSINEDSSNSDVTIEETPELNSVIVPGETTSNQATIQTSISIDSDDSLSLHFIDNPEGFVELPTFVFGDNASAETTEEAANDSTATKSNLNREP